MPVLTPNRVFVGFSTLETSSKQQQFADIPLIRRDLLNAFNTLPGERVMMPTFGCTVWDMLFEPFDEALVDAVIAECTRIINYETRVILQDMQVTEFNQGLLVQITLIYQPYNVLDTFSVEFDRRAIDMSTEGY
jgi:phage baseplate assembly protein W